MSRRAWIYVLGIVFLGTLVVVVSALTPVATQADWIAFATLTVLATIAQFLGVEAPGRQHYYPHLIFFFAAFLLMPPLLFCLAVIIPHLVEWAQKRLTRSPYLRNWYLQPFNISTHLIAGFLARASWNFLRPEAEPWASVLGVFAVMTAALVYAIVDHAIVGQVLVLARKISWRESGVLESENVLTDLVMLLVGYMVAALWRVNPWLIVPALSPLALIYRALTVPKLKQEAQTDAKTGLLNARHWNKLLAEYLERAGRLDQPLALIMADLDLLRNINNTHGHLAGDAALVGVSQIILAGIRGKDFAGRFGGEEFAIALPDTGLNEAVAVAERIRRTVEAGEFHVSSVPVPIHVTLSLGVACFPQHGTEAQSLIHEADVALYQAKLAGRNRVGSASDVPHSAKLEKAPAPQVEAVAYPVAGAPAIAHAEPSSPAPVARLMTPTEDAKAAEKPLAPPPAMKPALTALLAGVIGVGLLVAVVGLVATPTPVWLTIGLLAAFAVLTELFPIMVYRHVTMSVSAAVNFAAGLVAGVPGVVFASAAIVLSHYSQKHPPLYRTAFNWATHVLAGVMPALVMHFLGLPLTVGNLPLLVVPVALSGLAYYLMDTGLVAVAISVENAQPLLATWREQFRWLALYYLVLSLMGLVLAVAYITMGPLGVMIFALPLFMLRYALQQYVARTEEAVHELQRMSQELSQANKEIIGASKAIRQLNDELFLTLAKIIDARDSFVYGHSAKVADYALAIAAELKLPAERAAFLRQAALLHDIGKIGVSERILNKPASLTATEYQRMQAHVILGAEFLETSQNLRELAPFVRHHHEWWDGNGYPSALRGEAIPLEARILAVCDAVEAMASDRPYHKGLALGEIVTELKRCSGTQFDPAVIAAFSRVVEREGEQLVINSAREVVRRAGGDGRDVEERGWMIGSSSLTPAAAA